MRWFVVSCAGCGRVLMSVERIRDAEVAVLAEHLRACWQLESAGEELAAGAIMERVRVVVKEE